MSHWFDPSPDHNNIKKKQMAKSSKGSSSASRKISFGKKKTGVHKKSFSKYEQKPKKYVGQGR